MRQGGRRRITRRGSLALLAGAGLLLVGCAEDDDPGQTPAPDLPVSPTVEATPTLPPEASLGPVIWSTSLSEEGEPDVVVETLTRDAPVIYASVEGTNLDQGETVTATWTLDGQPIEGIDSAVTIEEDAERGWVTFSLPWEGEAMWPVGQLGVTITASTGATSTGQIQIVSNQ